VFTVQVLKALPVSLTQESYHSILFVKDGLCFTLIDVFLGKLLRTLLMHKLHGMLFFVVRMYLSCTQRGIISHSIIQSAHTPPRWKGAKLFGQKPLFCPRAQIQKNHLAKLKGISLKNGEPLLNCMGVYN